MCAQKSCGAEIKMNKYKRLFEEQSNFLIIGKKGSAKTALGFHYMKGQGKYGNREMYFYNHPQSELLEKLPFKVTNLTKMVQLLNLTDAVVLIDEAQRHFDVLNKRVNEELKDLLAMSRQNNVSVIFVAHNSSFITRGLFSYIDVKLIKEVVEDHWELERKHMAVRYRKSKCAVVGKESYYLDSDEIKSKCNFKKPSWYTDELSNAYRNKKDDCVDVMVEAEKCDKKEKCAESAEKEYALV